MERGRHGGLLLQANVLAFTIRALCFKNGGGVGQVRGLEGVEGIWPDCLKVEGLGKSG